MQEAAAILGSQNRTQGRCVNNLARKNYTQFIDDIKISAANPGKCSVPCKIIRYDSKEIGLRDHSEQRGLTIRFDDEVAIVKSSFQMDEMSLLSKIGGFIGISKNFLWLVIVLISSVGTLHSSLN